MSSSLGDLLTEIIWGESFPNWELLFSSAPELKQLWKCGHLIMKRKVVTRWGRFMVCRALNKWSLEPHSCDLSGDLLYSTPLRKLQVNKVTSTRSHRYQQGGFDTSKVCTKQVMVLPVLRWRCSPPYWSLSINSPSEKVAAISAKLPCKGS